MAELLARLSARELAEWRAFDRLEPFGDRRADVRLGIMAALFANAHRAAGAKPFTPRDFLPVFDAEEAEAERRQTVADQILAAFAQRQQKVD